MDQSTSLKNAGLKATVPRLRILDLLRASEQRHLSADEIYRRLALDDGVEIGIATIYRALTQLERAGLVSRIVFDASRAVFELNQGQHHDHLVCVGCGRVEEFYDASIEQLQHTLASDRGFDLQDHRHALFGLCPSCKPTGSPASTVQSPFTSTDGTTDGEP